MEFNKEKEYINKVKEQVDNLIIACRTENLPCFISIAVANDNSKTTYKNEAITPNSINVKITDDKISEHINVMNGFTTVPYTELYEKKGAKSVTDTDDDWADSLDIEEIIPQ